MNSFCMEKNAAYQNETSTLHPKRWREPGWESREAYETFLNTSTLVAFSHCTHYCVTERIIIADEEQNTISQGTPFNFKVRTQTEINNKPQKTPIYSVKGFEYRGFIQTPYSTFAQSLEDVKQHALLTMLHLLLVAEKTNTTDIVLSQYLSWHGVFTREHRFIPLYF